MDTSTEHAIDRLKEMGLDADKTHFEKKLKNADEELVSLYIQAGINPDIADANGYTPLMNAVMFGNTKAAKALINHKVKINATNRYGKNALMMAVISGNIEMTRLLLEHNADPNSASSTGETPLLLAVKSGNEELVTLLLKKGADPAYATTDINPLELSRKLNKNNITELLLTISKEEKNKPAKDDISLPETKKSPVGHKEFHNAIARGDKDQVEQWLKEGLNPNMPTDKGYTPLMTAVSFDKPEIVDLLLARNPRINQRNRNGYTALHIAVIGNNSNCVEKLLKADSDPDVLSSNGDTPLIKAMIIQNIEIVRLLLKYNADPNIINNGGYNAISLAVMKKAKNILSILLEAGADISVTSQNETPLERAERIGATEIAELIKAHQTT